MKPVCGPRLEIDEPTESELAWIYEALQSPEIHLPLSCPSPPTRAQFDAGQIETVERGERGVLMPRFFVGRSCKSGDPVAFFLVFGWGGPFDTVRDLDLAIPERGVPIWTYVEANLMFGIYLFRHRLARRVRWRVAQERFGELSWYDRIGARRLTHFDEPHPTSGEPIAKIIYEVSPAEYDAFLALAGLSLDQESDTYDIPWRKLMRQR